MSLPRGETATVVAAAGGGRPAAGRTAGRVAHASLTPERWARFGLPRQILMVANEVNRARRALGCGDGGGARQAYGRALELLDLTVAVHRGEPVVRELLRWRLLAAEQFLAEAPDPARAGALLKALLLLSGPSARQVPHLSL